MGDEEIAGLVVKIATGIIGNNNDDAVVRFLIERLKQKKCKMNRKNIEEV